MGTGKVVVVISLCLWVYLPIFQNDAMGKVSFVWFFLLGFLCLACDHFITLYSFKFYSLLVLFLAVSYSSSSSVY